MKTRAQIKNIWNYVNFHIIMRSFHIIKFIESMYEELLKTTKNFNLKNFELYKTRTIIYKTQLMKYFIQHKTFKKFIIFIQNIIFIIVDIFIQEIKIHFWNLLRALKKRLISFDEFCKLKIEIKYQYFCRNPNNRKIDKWFDSWQLIYSKGEKFQITKMQGNKSIKDFIFSLMKKNEA